MSAAPSGARASAGPLAILHLTHQGFGAGSTISIAALAHAQHGLGHRVLVGCPEGSLLAELARADGLEVVPLAFSRIGRLGAAIATLVQQRRIDVVNSHASRDRAACRRARLLGRLPAALVMTRRGMPRSLPVSVVLNGFAADRTIAVSRAVAEALVRRGAPPWRLSVVPNAADLRRVDREVSPLELERARALIGASPSRATVGVVARRKDHAVLLAALRLLQRPVTLACVGTPGDADLGALAAAVAPHHVAFVPFQRDALPFYRLFDLVALPSRHEGMSQALLEAMALGLPVVASGAGGNVDLVRDGENGLLVAPRSPAAFAAAIGRLLGEPGLARRLGERARGTARGEFTLARTCALTDAAYRAALAHRP